MSDIRIGIIGAGYIASKHLEVIDQIKGLKVIGITSRTLSKAKKMAKKYNINNVYNNYQELIKNNQLDGILILVSAEQVYSVSTKIIPYKIPLFIEKPPGLNFKEIKKIYEKAKKYKCKNMVGFNRRYLSIFNKGLKIINNKGGLLGILIEGHERFWKIKNIITKKNRKNYLFSNSCHTIDLLRFFGGDIKKVYINKHSLIEKYGDQFSISLRFNNDILGTYIANWYSPGGWSVKLFGNGVTVQFQPLEEGIWYDKDMTPHKIKPNKEDLIYKPGFYNQMIGFKNLLSKGSLKFPGQDLESIYQTYKLINKISNEQ